MTTTSSKLLQILAVARKKPTRQVPLYQEFAPRVAREIQQRRQPGEDELARVACAAASVVEEPETLWILQARRQAALTGDAVPQEEHWYIDPADLIGLDDKMFFGPARGRRMTPQQRSDLGERLIELAAEALAFEGNERWRGAPGWIKCALVEDRLRRQVGLDTGLKARLVPVDKDVAFEFVKRHHSALGSARMSPGLLFAVGLKAGNRLVGVGLLNTPTGRFKDPHHVVEVTRIASDGTVYGASSTIMHELMRWTNRSQRYGSTKPGLLVTYSLLTEPGTTYKALMDEGLRPTQLMVRSVAGGARSGGDAPLVQIPKIRWEYGAEAAPSESSLLRLVRPFTKAFEGRKLTKKDLSKLNADRLRDLWQALGGSKRQVARQEAAQIRDRIVQRFG